MQQPDDIKRLDVAEFRRLGYLQELNRRFLHPLGMALEVLIDDDGTERFGQVWDYRDDPEGMRFADGVIDSTMADRVDGEWREKAQSRDRLLGWAVQPKGR